MGPESDRGKIQRDLEDIISRLKALLPTYVRLKAKKQLSSEELRELGEIEYLLIEISPQLNQISYLLNQDVYGQSVDLYYRLKKDAQAGDDNALCLLERLKPALLCGFRGVEGFALWN